MNRNRESFPRSDEPVATEEMIARYEEREQKKQEKQEKTRQVLGSIAAGAMMIPGADLIKSVWTSHKLQKKRVHNYRLKNGTLFGNDKKGYESTLKRDFYRNRQEIIENHLSARDHEDNE